MIKPIFPHEPIKGITAENGSFSLIFCILIAVLSIITAVITAKYAAGRFNANRKRTTAVFVSAALTISSGMLLVFGSSMIAVKGILFAFILAFSSYEDIKTRECDDHLHLLTAVAAFIGTDICSVPNMLLSAFFVGGIMILTMIITKSKLGGADIKMAAGCAFLLGLERGILGLLAGMTLAVIVNLIKKNRKHGFPNIPYLAAGFLAAYFI